MSSHRYDELSGGFGRAIHFRPTRYRVRDLLREYPPELLVDGRRYLLQDLAMNGLAFSAPRRIDGFEIGGEHEIDLKLSDQLVFSGRGRVARREESRSSVRIGMSLVDGFIDVPKLVDRHEAISLASQLDDGADRQRARIPEAYRAAIERAVHFVQYYKRLLDQHESRLRERGAGEGEITDLARRAFDSVVDRWHEAREQACVTAWEYRGDLATVQVMKRYTETMLTSLLADAPLVRQAYEKPRGYPGDFDTMRYIYGNDFEGRTAFAKLMHKLFCCDPMAHGVRRRKDFLKQLQADEARQVLAGGSARGRLQVTSVGCGPALEVEEFIREHSEWAGQTSWTLVDQEEAALSLAYNRCFRALSAGQGNDRLRCLYLSFTRMISEPELMQDQGGQDVIYIAGIADYLTQSTCRRLVAVMAERLAPGGVLCVANAIRPNVWSWACEYVLDWTLVYRDEHELRDMAADVAVPVDVAIDMKWNDVFGFVLVRRK